MSRTDASWAVRWGNFVPLALSRRLTRRGLVSFFYHTVSDVRLPHVENLFGYKSAAMFEQDLLYLQAQFDLPTHDEIKRMPESGTQPRRPAAAIGFDDGLRECFDVARPLLTKHRIPCTFFIITDAVDHGLLMFRNKVSLFLDRWKALDRDRRAALREEVARRFSETFAADTALLAWAERLSARQTEEADALCDAVGIDVAAFLRTNKPYMTREEIVQLHRDGFTIGAHTRTHPRLWELKDEREVEREIVESCAAVRDWTGQATVPFAFPFNGLWMKRDRLDAIRKRCGFIDLFYDSNNLMRDRDFVVNRIWVDSPEGASAAVSNLPRLLRRAYALEPLRAMKRRM